MCLGFKPTMLWGPPSSNTLDAVDLAPLSKSHRTGLAARPAWALPPRKGAGCSETPHRDEGCWVFTKRRDGWEAHWVWGAGGISFLGSSTLGEGGHWPLNWPSDREVASPCVFSFWAQAYLLSAGNLCLNLKNRNVFSWLILDPGS